MSPVPEKKQGRVGRVIWKMRGVWVEVEVEPRIWRVWLLVVVVVGGGLEGEGESWTDVTIMWGIWYVEWRVEIAWAREDGEVMGMPDRVLGGSDQ